MANYHMTRLRRGKPPLTWSGSVKAYPIIIGSDPKKCNISLSGSRSIGAEHVHISRLMRSVKVEARCFTLAVDIALDSTKIIKLSQSSASFAVDTDQYPNWELRLKSLSIRLTPMQQSDSSAGHALLTRSTSSLLDLSLFNPDSSSSLGYRSAPLPTPSFSVDLTFYACGHPPTRHYGVQLPIVLGTNQDCYPKLPAYFPRLREVAPQHIKILANENNSVWIVNVADEYDVTGSVTVNGMKVICGSPRVLDKLPVVGLRLLGLAIHISLSANTHETLQRSYSDITAPISPLPAITAPPAPERAKRGFSDFSDTVAFRAHVAELEKSARPISKLMEPPEPLDLPEPPELIDSAHALAQAVILPPRRCDLKHRLEDNSSLQLGVHNRKRLREICKRFFPY